MDTTPACFIGLDMGTTNTRAWLVEGERIVASARAPVGIRDSAVAGGPQVLRSAVARLVAELRERGTGDAPPPEIILAAGMITSSHGLAEVPHVAAPAGVAELSAGARRHRFPEISELDVLLVPGVRTGPERLPREEIGAADVMRGEETLCVGLHAAGLIPPGGTLLNLGSHWKAIRLDRAGRVIASTTSLAGELLHAAQTRTILAGSVPAERPGRMDREWLHAGMSESRRSGLERALFCVRLLEQRTTSTPEQRLGYLVGAFIGSALPHLIALLPEAGPVVIAGGEGLGEAVGAALAGEGREVRMLSPADVENGMVRGLSLVVRAMRNEGGPPPPS